MPESDATLNGLPELTDEMLEAGRRALADWHYYRSDVVTEEQAIREIWSAIRASSRQAVAKPSRQNRTRPKIHC